jgi:peroxiredoxin/ABC-type uncharacterized transport system YnjBCD ATPase subunit
MLGLEDPAAGAIYYDGQDLRALDLTAVRRQVATVLQNGRVPPGSIRDAVRGLTEANDAEVWQALSRAALAEEVKATPMGLETLATDATRVLSGGQAQRLLLARALVQKPAVLVLDEATSALDNITQRATMRAVRAMPATRIVVAHRLSTIRPPTASSSCRTAAPRRWAASVSSCPARVGSFGGSTTRSCAGNPARRPRGSPAQRAAPRRAAEAISGPEAVRGRGVARHVRGQRVGAEPGRRLRPAPRAGTARQGAGQQQAARAQPPTPPMPAPPRPSRQRPALAPPGRPGCVTRHHDPPAPWTHCRHTAFPHGRGTRDAWRRLSARSPRASRLTRSPSAPQGCGRDMEGAAMDPAHDFTKLPAKLPAPPDDGACAGLVGRRLPPLDLPSTAGRLVRMDALPLPRTVLYCYPMTGRPGVAQPEGWDAIPGARGCTAQSCGFRDHAAEMAALGATVFGLSTQDTAYQREMAERLHLPFEVLSDEGRAFAGALGLPTFEAGGMTLLRRATLVIRDGAVIEHVLYPVFPPDRSAADTLAWLHANPRPLLPPP